MVYIKKMCVRPCDVDDSSLSIGRVDDRVHPPLLRFETCEGISPKYSVGFPGYFGYLNHLQVDTVTAFNSCTKCMGSRA